MPATLSLSFVCNPKNEDKTMPKKALNLQMRPLLKGGGSDELG